jgi:hypothetical protein
MHSDVNDPLYATYFEGTEYDPRKEAAEALLFLKETLQGDEAEASLLEFNDQLRIIGHQLEGIVDSETLQKGMEEARKGNYDIASRILGIREQYDSISAEDYIE